MKRRTNSGTVNGHPPSEIMKAPYHYRYQMKGPPPPPPDSPQSTLHYVTSRTSKMASALPVGSFNLYCMLLLVLLSVTRGVYSSPEASPMMLVGPPSLGLDMEAEVGAIDPSSTLECHLREFTYRVFRVDSLGRKCWDYVTVMSCWGRCDSNEIADWQFPYKLSHHPVCIHGERELRRIELANCEPETEMGTATYEYYEAITCSCRQCHSSFASCEGLHRY